MFLGAVLYTSVGHAGASAYIALMALFGVVPVADHCRAEADRGLLSKRRAAYSANHKQRPAQFARLLSPTRSQNKAARVKHNAHMTGDSTVILGIEIPSTDPVFVGVIVGIHIPLGLACVVAGAVAMLSAPGTPFDAPCGQATRM
jgi:hypothetical protein